MTVSDWTPSVAVDLDGVLAQYDGWEGLEEIGDPVDGSQSFMEGLQDLGVEVVVHTTRMNPDPFYDGEERHRPEEAREILESWLERNGIPYDRVFTGTGKPIASAYVDDRAVLCRPDGDRIESALEFKAALAHVESMLEPRG